MRGQARALARRLRLLPALHVSIVVATYRSDPGRLEALMASVAAQSMPAEHVEVVFVDDGSADGTLERLQAIARTRPDVVVRGIANSGWAGRPRNVGTRLAHGTYVLYMDHDDVLFPRALERAYAYGRRHRADVVNAKEVRTQGWSWGWDTYAADVPRAEHVDPTALIPMTPHKLYRRRFLLTQGVRFPEGPRVFWEDIYFNIAAFARGARVSVLAQQPFYHWVRTEGSGSGTFSRDPEEYWSNLVDLFDWLGETLAPARGGAALLAHQVRVRALAASSAALLRGSEDEAALAYDAVRRIVAAHAPPGVDGELRSVDRCRLELLRADRQDLLVRLAEHDAGTTARPDLLDASWEGPELVLTVGTTLVDRDGEPVRLRREGERWLRDLPADVAEQLSVEARDVTRDLAEATLRLSVKGRESRSTWALAGQGVVRCTPGPDGLGTVSAVVTARFDPRSCAVEHDVPDRVWEVAARLEVMGHAVHRGVQQGRAVPAVLDGEPTLAYLNRSGLLSVSVGAAPQTVLAAATWDAARAEVTARPQDGAVLVEVAVPIGGVPAVGTARLEGRVLLGELAVPAQVATGDGRAVLRFTAEVPPGEHVVSTRFGGRTGRTPLVLVVESAGARLLDAPSDVAAAT